MNTKQRWILGILLAGVALGSLPILLGSSLPEKHSVSVSETISASPNEIFDTLSNFEKMHEWVPQIAPMKAAGHKDGLPVYQADHPQLVLTFTFLEVQKPRLLRVQMSSNTDQYSGVWNYQLEAMGDRTKVTITEEGTIKSAFFRFVNHYFTGHDGTIKTVLFGLQQKYESGK